MRYIDLRAVDYLAWRALPIASECVNDCLFYKVTVKTLDDRRLIDPPAKSYIELMTPSHPPTKRNPRESSPSLVSPDEGLHEPRVGGLTLGVELLHLLGQLRLPLHVPVGKGSTRACPEDVLPRVCRNKSDAGTRKQCMQSGRHRRVHGKGWDG